MANPWFRFYSEFQDDCKIQMLPLTMRYYFVMLLCSRCKAEPLTDEVIAYQWRLSESEVSEIKALFVERGFIDAEWTVLKWDKRQYVSDNSRDRTQKYRDKKKPVTQNVTVTEKSRHNGRHSDLPEADTDTEGLAARRYF